MQRSSFIMLPTDPLRKRNPGGPAALSFHNRSAPAGKIVGVRAFAQSERILHGRTEVLFDHASFDPPAQKVGPEKLAERGRVLGEAADATQFAGEAAVRIIREGGNGFGNLGELTSAPGRVIVMHPAAMIENHPEFV